MKECICKDELMIDKVYCHLAWCPHSYVYKRDVEEYENLNWFLKLFRRDPRKYYNYLQF